MERQPDRFKSRWIWANTWGWLAGFVLTIILSTLWGMIGSEIQSIVGVSMGAGVGYMQSRVLREVVDRARPWIWRSVIGMGLPFLLWDISGALGVEMFFSLPVSVLLGGFLVGILQRSLFPPHYSRAIWWIPASVFGWGIPMGLIKLGDLKLVSGPMSIIFVIPMLFGGVILGAVTCGVISRMPRRSTA